MVAPRNLLVIVVDCLGSDALLGAERTSSTPRLDDVCQRGAVLPNTITSASYTTASVASILTGLYPPAHGIRSQSAQHKLSAGVPSLASVLREAGYCTAASVTGPLGKEIGLDRGFQRFEFRGKDEVAFGSWGEAFLEEFPRGLREPWFLFVHLWELHTPRRVAPEHNTPQSGETPYDRALSSIDPFVGELAENALKQGALVVVTGDHGEDISRGSRAGARQLLKSALRRFNVLLKLARTLDRAWGLRRRVRNLGLAFHGYHVYDVLARVPLIIAGPNGLGEGQHLAQQVRTIDIFPTVLECLGIDAPGPPPCQGKSLVPLLRGGALEEEPAVTEALRHPERFLTYLLVGLRTPQWKLAFAEDDPDVPWELYNLLDDPGEERNVAGQFPREAEDLHRQATEILIAGAGLRQQGEALSSEEKAIVQTRLRELGYL